MIRVFVVGDSPVARAGIVGLLAGDDRVAVVGQAPARTTEPAQLVGAGDADVVVAAVNLDDERATAAVLALAAHVGASAVVAVVDHEGHVWPGEALRAGVRAVVPRDADAVELRAAIAAAAAGLVVMRPDQVPDGVRAAPPREGRLAAGAPLTRRELEVLGLLGEGLGNKAIAARLAISERTVKFHVGAIFEKLDVTSRTEAVTAALRRGLILL